jgi:hypothetical protein
LAETPHFLKALGRQALPAEIDIDGRRFTLQRTFKNDFFAVTAQYASAGDKLILKVSRRASLFGLPMQWIGRILAAKERAVLTQLQDLPGIPRFVGDWGPTGIVRQFIEGRHLTKGMYVADGFHAELRALISQIHTRGMAYVDLEKAENVLVGEDGKPYLFDFQIAWYLPRRWGGELLPARLVRRWLQRGDLYHLVKLQRRTRPDQLTADELARSYRRPLMVRLYRLISYPFTWVRRRVLQWIDPRRAPGERGRVMEDCPRGA